MGLKTWQQVETHQCVKNLSDFSTSMLGTLKAMTSYGAAWNSRYCTTHESVHQTLQSMYVFDMVASCSLMQIGAHVISSDALSTAKLTSCGLRYTCQPDSNSTERLWV